MSLAGKVFGPKKLSEAGRGFRVGHQSCSVVDDGLLGRANNEAPDVELKVEGGSELASSRSSLLSMLEIDPYSTLLDVPGVVDGWVLILFNNNYRCCSLRVVLNHRRSRCSRRICFII